MKTGMADRRIRTHMMRRSDDGRQNPVLGTRTFSYLGPNSADLTVGMGGRQRMSDGAAIRTWFFGSGFNGDRSVPGPVIEAIEGETVRVTLSSRMPHSIHWHGLDVDQANDGVPSTSGYVAHHRAGGRHGARHGGGRMDFGRVSGYTNLGSPFTYTFIAPHAGTYMYHCHVDTVLHVEMGMYGTVIIRPAVGNTDRAWANGPTFDKEYIWHLHTFDSSWHRNMVSGPGTVRHHPDYFMINGRDGFDTLSDATTAIEAGPGEKVLIRCTNVGYQLAQVQLDGLLFDVIASDGRPLAETIRTTSLMVAPGERYDILLTMPSSGRRSATVDYLHIRGDGTLLGTATTSIAVV